MADKERAVSTMNNEGKAVFLSYASQDAEAAKRICEALRQAGVEVWFDQSELRGGDAWDAMIRKRIKECALFVPIISANTQARAEGYFRLEWRLAEQRTHLMGKSRAFLLPVCIDDTRDSEADVPDSFLAVQWIRLQSGEATPAFCERVRDLLEGESGAERIRPVASSRATPPESSVTRRTARGRWVLLAAVAVAAIAVAVYHSLESAGDAKPAVREAKSAGADGAPQVATSGTGAAYSAARQLAQQAWQLALNSPRDSQGMASAIDMAERAIALDKLDGEVWAYAARVDLHSINLGLDLASERQIPIRTKVARSKALAPRSYHTRVVEALMLVRLDKTEDSLAEAEQILRELTTETPDGLAAVEVLGHLGGVLANQGSLLHGKEALRRYLEAAEMCERAAAAEAAAGEGGAGWIGAVSWHYQRAGRWDKALTAAEEAVKANREFGLAHLARVHIARGDFAAARAALQQMTPAARRESKTLHLEVSLAFYSRDPEGMLTALRLMPDEQIENLVSLPTPLRLYTGWAHQIADRMAAARLEWQEALRWVEQKLAEDSTSAELRWSQFQLLALLGRTNEAAQVGLLMRQLNVVKTGQEGALFHAVLGNREETIRQAEREAQAAHIFARDWTAWRYAPVFDFVRDDPRWQKLLRDTIPPGAVPFADQPEAVPSPASASSVPPDSKSVAVLAFENRSSERDSEYFSNGVSDELITVLGSVAGLKVVARTSSFAFKGNRAASAQEIARALGVTHLVEGSVQQVGGKARVIARLIRADTGEQLWGASFDTEVNDILSAQVTTARAIAQAMALRLETGGSRESFKPEAVQLYLQGRQEWGRRTTEGMRRAEDLFMQAIALEPKFARAHAGLVEAWLVLGQYDDAVGLFEERDSAGIRRMVERARLAVGLDPESAESQASLGGALAEAWQLAEARRALERALVLNPNYATAHQWLGRLLLTEGRASEAVASLQRACELDPLSSRMADNLGLSLWLIGRGHEGLAELDRALVSDGGPMSAANSPRRPRGAWNRLTVSSDSHRSGPA